MFFYIFQRTVIVMNRESVPAVQNVTDQSLTLDHCEPSLAYTVECHNETNMLMGSTVSLAVLAGNKDYGFSLLIHVFIRNRYFLSEKIEFPRR